MVKKPYHAATILHGRPASFAFASCTASAAARASNIAFVLDGRFGLDLTGLSPLYTLRAPLSSLHGWPPCCILESNRGQ